MFGKPEWFREKDRDLVGLIPASWQGWAYTGVWAAAGGIPFLGLMIPGKVVEAVIWAVFVGLALVWDVRKIKHAVQATVVDENLLVIDEEDSTLNTRSFDMHLR